MNPSNTDSVTLCQTLSSSRWLMSYALFLSLAWFAAFRVNMGLAIICMVTDRTIQPTLNNGTSLNSTDVNRSNNSNAPEDCPYAVTTLHAETSNWNTGSNRVEWSKTLESYVLAGFFIGLLLSQIPAGYLSQRFGGRRVLMYGLSAYSITYLLIPLATRINKDEFDNHTSAYLVCALRVLAGLAGGVIQPACFCLWGRWLPPLERTKHVSFCFSGEMAGSVLALSLGGLFCNWKSFDGGWPSMFYLPSILCLLSVVLIYFMVHDSPSTHPRIQQSERDYIRNSLETQEEVTKNVPWRKALTCKAVWAIWVAHFMFNFGDAAAVTKMPSYLKDVLGYDTTNNGLISTLPFIAMFVVSNLSGEIVDYLRSKFQIKTAITRKVCTGIGLAGASAPLVALGYVTKNQQALAVSLYVIGLGLFGFMRPGFLSNILDIAPRYSGELFAVSNTLASLPGIIFPPLINSLTPTGDLSEWRVVFFILGGVFCLGALIYAILGEGHLQSWAADTDERSTDNETALDDGKFVERGVDNMAVTVLDEV